MHVSRSTRNEALTTQGPSNHAGTWTWTASAGAVEVRFIGRSPGRNLPESAEPHLPEGYASSWVHQVHGADVLDARAGCSGEGDALTTSERDLGLVVVTADCVPIVIGSDTELAVVHAGWRGIVAGVIPAAFERLSTGDRELSVLIGPAIGACCYEVGDDVAEQISNASSTDVIVDRGQPHADLQAAAVAQVSAAGADRISVISRCTACDAQRLHSYRRDGANAGRNLTLAWLR